MQDSISKKIENRINKFPDGEIFFTSDFNDISSNTTIRKVLGRFTNKGLIRRVMDGVYEKPEFFKLTNSFLPTDPNKVAYAIAKKYHWNIAPSEDLALNMLGLSTQVPASLVYVSDGPYRQYEFNDIVIKFKHKTNREISNLSDETVLLIECLKTLGKEKIDDNVIKRLSKYYSKLQKKKILIESSDSPEWIHMKIKKICK